MWHTRNYTQHKSIANQFINCKSLLQIFDNQAINQINQSIHRLIDQLNVLNNQSQLSAGKTFSQLCGRPLGHVYTLVALLLLLLLYDLYSANFEDRVGGDQWHRKLQATASLTSGHRQQQQVEQTSNIFRKSAVEGPFAPFRLIWFG